MAGASDSSMRGGGAARLLGFLVGLAAGAMMVAVLTVLIPLVAPDPLDARLSGLLLGREPGEFGLSIQAAMWLLFGVGLAEVLARLMAASGQRRQTRLNLLPEDDATMLRAEDLGPLAARARETAPRGGYYLQALMLRVIFQFQAGRSVAQANDILNSSLELHQNELGLRYSLLRYIVWLIPTLGFIGTVWGIALALDEAGRVPDVTNAVEMNAWMGLITAKLTVAFDTTLLALALSAVLVFMLHVAEEREEGALNHAGQYCLDNLINRLYER